MGTIIRQTTELAMHIVSAYVNPGDVLVDATSGNGKDTLALAAMNPAQLYAFDAQEAAVQETIRLLEENGYGDRLADSGKGIPADDGLTGCRIIVRQLAHENLCEFFRNEAGAEAQETARPLTAVVFNLGYLPGGDKHITTKTETTIKAVRDAMELICSDGLVCITMYSGHPEGRKEKAALLEFAEELDAAKWHCAYISMPNQKNDPPEILLITRKG
ncbi:MAG: class I SAM-dependent methyltransferase [Firmicutes bacterium]|nr:class I SAM-dependent methyltransferase [Bacillota bacterium]